MSTDPRLTDTIAQLAKLERGEWWRWATVFVISLVLTIGMFTLKLPSFRHDFLAASQLDNALWGLLGLVLLFDIFAVYQQLRISRLRRELSEQIATIATLEAIRPPATDPQEIIQKNRRILPRFLFDQRLKVEIVGTARKAVFGRTRDLSEGGVGGVIADPLEIGTRVELEFPVPVGSVPLRMSGIVRFRRGFHHGFEFLLLDANDLSVIKKICAESEMVH